MRLGFSLALWLLTFGSSSWSADLPALKLFDLSGPQLRPVLPLRAERALTNGLVVAQEVELQTKLAAELELHLQRHEAMNGSPLLTLQRIARGEGVQRALDSFLPAGGGGFLQKNPNALSSPLDRAGFWTK